jgi:hypothetical protein
MVSKRDPRVAALGTKKRISQKRDVRPYEADEDFGFTYSSGSENEDESALPFLRPSC